MSPAVEDKPTQIPDAGVVRDARSRQRSRQRRILAAALFAVALGVIGGIVGGAGSGSSAQAGQESFEAFALRHHLSAEGICRSLLPSESELSSEGLRRHFGDPQDSYGFWRTILVDRIGPHTWFLFESADRRADWQCFVGRKPKSATTGGGYGTRPDPPVPAHSVSEPMSGGIRTLPEEGSEKFSWIAARVGADVQSVTIRFLDGGHTIARIANGWYFAEWRGRRPLARADAIVAR